MEGTEYKISSKGSSLVSCTRKHSALSNDILVPKAQALIEHFVNMRGENPVNSDFEVVALTCAIVERIFDEFKEWERFKGKHGTGVFNVLKSELVLLIVGDVFTALYDAHMVPSNIQDEIEITIRNRDDVLSMICIITEIFNISRISISKLPESRKSRLAFCFCCCK